MRLAWIIIAVAACGSSPRVPGGRFANRPAVATVNDRRDVPKTPDEREFIHGVYHYDGVVRYTVDRPLGLPPPRRALGVNALDEVPDSTWFTNRIGVRDLSIEELVRGPVTIESPEQHRPWKIKSTKVGGAQVGFLFEDARGEKFLLKFDTKGVPEQETAAGVIVGKLFWAFGYNVPEDFVVDLHRDDLVIAEDAVMVDKIGKKRPLDRATLDQLLTGVEVEPDGRIRALASRFLGGKPLGGHSAEGVRDDDPNDRIPHELRRDLRGAFPLFAWLDHVDVQESNFLDMWVEDRANPKHHYVKHYYLDFGKSLGVMATAARDRRSGQAYTIDLGDLGRQLLFAGAIPRRWEQREHPGLRGIGLYDASTFDPGEWRPNWPSYVPFLTSDRFDRFWGAKILMRFTREQLRAVVETGRLSDPRAAAYLVDTLVARQRATGAYWFARVNPLDRFTMSGDRLCFDDLAIRYRFTAAATTSYRATSYDRDERPLGVAGELSDTRGHARGRACMPVTLADDDDGYTMIRVETTRPGFTGSTIVHVARDLASATPRVVGIWRL
jgi:hypothetical protein